MTQTVILLWTLAVLGVLYVAHLLQPYLLGALLGLAMALESLEREDREE